MSEDLLSLYAADAENEIRIITDKSYNVTYMEGLEPQQLRSKAGTVHVNMPTLRMDQAIIVADPAAFKVVRCGR